MKAAKLRMSGRVQRVGYRRYVLELAQDAGLAGSVKNEPDGSVTVFVQGDAGKLERFVREARKPPPPAAVKEVTRTSSKLLPRLKHFSIQSRGLAEELQEGFGAVQTEFSDYRSEFKDYKGEFRDFRQEFKDYRGEFKDYRQEFKGFASRTDENFKTLGDKYGEISAKLSNILETLQKESSETRAELKRSVDNLSRLVDEYIARGKQ